MLVLTRKIGEKLIIDDNIVITVVAVKGDQVRVAVSAPREKKIYRGEIYEAILEENQNAAKVRSFNELNAFYLKLNNEQKSKDSIKVEKIKE